MVLLLSLVLSSPEPFTCYASTLERGSQVYEASHRFHSVALREALELCRENSEDDTCYLSHCTPFIE